MFIYNILGIVLVAGDTKREKSTILQPFVVYSVVENVEVN